MRSIWTFSWTALMACAVVATATQKGHQAQACNGAPPTSSLVSGQTISVPDACLCNGKTLHVMGVNSIDPKTGLKYVSPTLRCEGEAGKSLVFDDTLLFDIDEFRADKK